MNRMISGSGAAAFTCLAGISIASADTNPFSMKEMQGYSEAVMVAEAKCGCIPPCGNTSKRTVEGKCGEGKCGSAPIKNVIQKPQYSPVDVKNIQIFFNRLGYNSGAVDGVWGKQTTSALKLYQRANKIPDSGIINDITITKIRDSLRVSNKFTAQDRNNILGSTNNIRGALSSRQSTPSSGMQAIAPDSQNTKTPTSNKLATTMYVTQGEWNGTWIFGKNKQIAEANMRKWCNQDLSSCKIILRCTGPGWVSWVSTMDDTHHIGYACGGQTKEEALKVAWSECNKRSHQANCDMGVAEYDDGNRGIEQGSWDGMWGKPSYVCDLNPTSGRIISSRKRW